MNSRRVIYIAFLVVVVFMLYYSGATQEDNQMQKYIPIDVILDNFTDIRTHSELGEYLPEDNKTDVEVHFPTGFKGWEGEVFYIHLYDGKNFSVHKYDIELNPDNERLFCQYKESWDRLKPPQDKFIVYRLVDGEWVKAD